MIEDIAFLDDETRPRAPAIPGASGAHRAHGRRLTLFHRFHLQQLALLRRAMEELARGYGEPEALAARVASLAMIENHRRFGNLCGQECQLLTMHHMIEDHEIFPRLRGGSEGLREVIDRLSAEHLVVHALLERLEEAAAEFAAEPGPARLAAVREVFDTLERVVISHFGYEERELEEALGFYGIPL